MQSDLRTINRCQATLRQGLKERSAVKIISREEKTLENVSQHSNPFEKEDEINEIFLPKLSSEMKNWIKRQREQEKEERRMKREQ